MCPAIFDTVGRPNREMFPIVEHIGVLRVLEDGQDEREGKGRKGDDIPSENGMIVIPILISGERLILPALFAEHSWGGDFIIDGFAILCPDQHPCVGGRFFGKPDTFTASLTGMGVGVIFGKLLPGILIFVEVFTRIDGWYHICNPLHWLILSQPCRKPGNSLWYGHGRFSIEVTGGGWGNFGRLCHSPPPVTINYHIHCLVFRQ